MWLLGLPWYWNMCTGKGRRHCDYFKKWNRRASIQTLLLQCTCPWRGQVCSSGSHSRKKLWVCEDWHTSTKFISKIVGRAIMVRDANCFHHFENGVCSAWTTGDSSNVSCQSLYHVLSGYSSMSSGSVTRSKLTSVSQANVNWSFGN
jgi:hypothetical protein